jgi:transposase
MNIIATTGLDVAKEVFQVHSIDADQKVVMTRSLKRKDVLTIFARLPAHLIGMEACGTAHHWARELSAFGHMVKMLPPRDVKGYLRRGKTDAADAEAICEAVTRARHKGVPIKSQEQQSGLLAHKLRESLLRQRTETTNRLRSHLAEFGLVAETGGTGIAKLVALVCDDGIATLPPRARLALQSLVRLIANIETELATLDAQIRVAHKANVTSRRLEAIPSVGPITAHAAAVTVADPHAFASARDFAASLGLTPRLDGTGGKVVLKSITKQGDKYLRRLLYLGAVSQCAAALRRPHRADPWLLRLLAEKPFKVAAIALANKTARIIWRLLISGEAYEPSHRSASKSPGHRARR